jgi:hypothetical protein
MPGITLDRTPGKIEKGPTLVNAYCRSGERLTFLNNKALCYTNIQRKTESLSSADIC